MDELRLTPQDIAGLVRVDRSDLRVAAMKRALPRIMRRQLGDIDIIRMNDRSVYRDERALLARYVGIRRSRGGSRAANRLPGAQPRSKIDG
jgi:hypothetical protein